MDICAYRGSGEYFKLCVLMQMVWGRKGMENREGSSIFRARNRRYGAPPATNASERPLDFHYKPLSACGWMERERKRERRASDIFLIFCVGCAFPVMRRIETERPGEETERERERSLLYPRY